MSIETETKTVVSDLRHLSDEQLAELGMPDLAYIKPVSMNGKPAFAIHAANGSPMAMASEREVAIAAIVQHEMFAALVH